MKITLLLLMFVVLGCALAQSQQDRTIYDKDISVIDYEDLDFPALALAARVEGIVVVHVKLDDNGKVLDAEALSGPTFLVRQSVENARKWRFKPNSKHAVIIVYNFRIEGACHSIRQGGSASRMIFYPPNFAAITVCPTPPMP
jgi:TonB family protein